MHQQVFSAPAGHPDGLAPHDSAAIGCVWELAVTDFERRAWLMHVLARPGGPDLAGYLAQELTDDVWVADQGLPAPVRRGMGVSRHRRPPDPALR